MLPPKPAATDCVGAAATVWPAGVAGVASAIASGRINIVTPAKIVIAVCQPNLSISATPIGE